MVKKLGLAILLATVAGVASASTPAGAPCTTHYFLGLDFLPYEVCTVVPPLRHVVAAPEIDAASAVAGLTLMIGGLAVLRGRRSNVVKA